MILKKLFSLNNSLLALCLVFVTNANAQPNPGRLEVVTSIAEVGDNVMEKTEIFLPDELYEGYLLWQQVDELALDVVNYTSLIDTEGNMVHRWDNDLGAVGNSPILLESGGLVRLVIRDLDYIKGQPVVASDILQITDKNGNAIWELDAADLDINGNKITFHHDLIIMPNGNIMIVIYEELTAEEAAAHGWVPGLGDTLWSDGVIEIKPNMEDGSYELVWLWRYVDHIIQDKDQSLANYAKVADHPEKIDAHFPTNYQPLNTARQHVNGLDYHEELDQIIISAFIYDEIWVIDHSTTIAEAASSEGGQRGKGGDLLFRYGNPASYDQGTAEDKLFNRQHDSHWIDPGLSGEGNIMVFNNNNKLTANLGRAGSSGERPGAGNRPAAGANPPNMAGGPRPNGPGGMSAAEMQMRMQGKSNFHEIKPVMDAQGNYVIGEDGTYEVEQVWLWESEGFFSPFQGGARRLPNGNTLITDTVRHAVWEIAPDGDVVARYTGEAPIYKAFKLSKEQVADLID